MKNKFTISLIISTHNRVSNILQIIKLLIRQTCFSYEYEIIICGSSFQDKTKIKTYIKNFLNLNIIYLESKINHQAFKRNLGAKNSSGKYLLFIDDDCFPDKNFFFNYFKKIKLNNNKIIYCGLVRHVKDESIKKLIRYRDETLISFNKPFYKNIPEKNFVSMNMCIPKNFLKKNSDLFDKRFRYYGFEDFELAFRLKENGYSIQLSKALVMHKDKRDFDVFLNKYIALVNGVDEIIKINFKAAKKSIFFKIKTNFLINIFIRIPMIYFFINYIIKCIVTIEKKTNWYSPLIYKSGIFFAFLKGLEVKYKVKNKYIYLLKKNNWYK